MAEEQKAIDTKATQQSEAKVQQSEIEKNLSNYVQKLVVQDGKLDVIKSVEAIQAMKHIINRMVDAVTVNMNKLKIAD